MQSTPVITLSTRLIPSALRNFEGVFCDGYTPNLVNTICDAILEATGIEVCILWERRDVSGFGGASGFVIRYRGKLYGFTGGDGLASFLMAGSDCPRTLKFTLDDECRFETEDGFNFARNDKRSEFDKEEKLPEPTAEEIAQARAKLDGGPLYSFCDYSAKDHLAQIRKSVDERDFLAVEEDGWTIGYMLSGHRRVIDRLNRYSLSRGCSQCRFDLRLMTEQELKDAPWDVLQGLIDDSKRRIIAYFQANNAERYAGMLNVFADETDAVTADAS